MKDERIEVLESVLDEIEEQIKTFDKPLTHDVAFGLKIAKAIVEGTIEGIKSQNLYRHLEKRYPSLKKLK